jgi:hypothetical protein
MLQIKLLFFVLFVSCLVLYNIETKMDIHMVAELTQLFI